MLVLPRRMRVQGTWTPEAKSRGGGDFDTDASYERSRSPGAHTAAEARGELIDETRQQVRVKIKDNKRTRAALLK